MIEQIFEEYNISENELKDKIYKTYCELHRLNPERWSNDFIEYISPDQPSLQIAGILLTIDPDEIQEVMKSSRATEMDLLRMTAYKLDFDLDNIKLEYLLKKQSFRNHFNRYYQIIFVFIVSIQLEKHQIDIKFDPDLVFDHLNKQPENLIELFDTVRASTFAKSIIDDYASSSDESNFFIEKITNFSKSVNSYIDENCAVASSIAVGNLMAEATTKFIKPLYESIELNESLPEDFQTNILNEFTKFNRKMVRERLELRKRGGSVKKKGFKWVDDKNKIKFYETVESLPKIKGVLMWDYAYENLDEADFNYKYIDYLQTQTIFKEVPESLFRKAIKTWKIYKDSFSKPKAEEKPKSFAFEYALHLLEFPETKYSSLVKYYGQGKKLSEINNLSKESSKK